MPTFPGVYSRISDQIGWIQSTICLISSIPPSEIDCSQVSSPGGIARAVPVTIILQFDDYPAETGWSIKNKESDNILVEVPASTYGVAQALTPETVFLPVGETYVFEIYDTFGDGLCCTTPGNYVVILGRNPNGDVLVTVCANGEFRCDFSLKTLSNKCRQTTRCSFLFLCLIPEKGRWRLRPPFSARISCPR